MQLSDNDIRDVNRYLQSGKPLPDKYRFLLFEDKREVELVWNGKTSEVTNVVLPFQVIEQIDEPRAENDLKMQMGLFDFDARGRQIKGWTNKLIWGDNKLILSSLKNGPLRKEIEDQGGIKLIYIDPPFDVGADFSMDVEIGDETLHKEASVLEELAYRDTWGKGADSFIAMIYERLSLMHDLLANDGSIYVHCDNRVSQYIRLVLDELFGKNCFHNEIIWKRSTAHSDSGGYGNLHDTLFYYSKSENYFFETQYDPYSEDYIKTYYRHEDRKGKFLDRDLSAKGLQGGGYSYSWKGKSGIWRCPISTMEQYEKDDKIYYTSNRTPRFKQYLHEMQGVPSQDIWTNIFTVNSQASERIDYPTQKPESLLERIIKTSSKDADVVADFFVGSGTMLAVAEKLGRKWIGTDIGKFSVHTTRKRMINIQRELKKQGKDYRAFEILNLGKYERQHYIGINPNLKNEEQEKQIAKRENDFVELILHAYRADKIDGFNTLLGKKVGRLVAIGPINLPVTRLYVEEVLNECRQKYITKVDILAFEFEMGLAPNMIDDAKVKGIDLSLKYIPRDVFDKRAVANNQVVFHDVSYLEVKPHVKGKSIAIELTDFSVYYNQDTVANVEATLRNGSNKIVIENGKIIKITKDKSGILSREELTKKWTDWIDYWAVDFNYESKKEVIRVQKEEASQTKIDGTIDPSQMALDQFKEVWTGDYIFENEWQSFRTKKNRHLELTSVYHECGKGRHKVAVKVVDIFGNDTMKVIELSI